METSTGLSKRNARKQAKEVERARERFEQLDQETTTQVSDGDSNDDGDGDGVRAR